MTEHPEPTPEPPGTGDGASPHLTPTERRLLDALQHDPDRVFSRADLVRLAMPNTIILERTIDVHIRSLRKKLGQGAVKTIYGQGYRLGKFRG
jgi:two-component system phosphate regulon response regulator PhoB